MPDLLCAHVPYPMLVANLDQVLEKRLNPEVFLPGEVLDTLIPEELQSVAEALTAGGLRCTIHAPFMDLNPGSVEPLIREATLRRFQQVLDAAAILKPAVVVMHPGYDRWRYGEQQDQWLRHAIATFRRVLEWSEPVGCTIAVENIFEEEPATLKALLEAVDHPRLRHCFDVGHWNLFGKVPLEEWFAELGSSIAEVHVHDNYGRRDDHAPIGEGNIDFPNYFELMRQYAPAAVYTIEAHCRAALDRALAAIAPYLG